MALALLILFLETQCTQLSKPTESQLRCPWQVISSRCSSRAHPTGSCFTLRASACHECQNRPMARNSPGAAACCAWVKKQHLCQGGQAGARKYCGEARAASISWSLITVGDVRVHPTAPTIRPQFQQSLKLCSSSWKGFQNQDHLVKGHCNNDNRGKCYK